MTPDYYEAHKEIILQKAKQQYVENKQKYKDKAAKWAKDNPEKRKEITKKCRDSQNSKQKVIDNRLKDWEKYLFNSVKRRAIQKEFEFNIEVCDIIIPDVCPYLKTPITKIHGKGVVWTNPSVDRIDSSKGYIKGNIEVISYLANTMKQGANKQQLLSFARSILEKFQGRA